LQILASLNHPHIGAIYELDEANSLQSSKVVEALERLRGSTDAADVAASPTRANSRTEKESREVERFTRCSAFWWSEKDCW
jgi:hypothetical protein